MPLYQYECTSCDENFESLADYHDDLPCPECGAMTRKMPTCASFKIRGFRASNGYGAKFIDTPGKCPDTNDDIGHSFSSTKAEPIDTNLGNR